MELIERQNSTSYSCDKQYELHIGPNPAVTVADSMNIIIALLLAYGFVFLYIFLKMRLAVQLFDR